MHNAFIAALGLSLGLSVGPVEGAPRDPGWRAPVVLVGLQLRDGTPAVEPAPTRPKSAPPARPRPATSEPASPPAALPDPSPARSPVDEAVDSAVRQQQLAGAAARAGAGPASSGVPLSAPAKNVVAEIARAAGLDGGHVVSAADTVRDQALFLVERLLDPRFGEADVRGSFGMAGALAVESYRRMRDIYQVLDLTAEQKRVVIDVVANALLAGHAVGQVDNPDYEMIDVDPGPRADRARFERAVAGHIAVARCLRPADGRAYVLEIPRRGAWLGGAVCRDAWAAPTPTARPAVTPSAASDAGFAAAPRAGSGVANGTVEVAPLPAGGVPGAARPPSSVPPADASAWKYIVTDGPQGPVVTLAPAR
jgi:hypothetical protein